MKAQQAPIEHSTLLANSQLLRPDGVRGVRVQFPAAHLADQQTLGHVARVLEKEGIFEGVQGSSVVRREGGST